jgi:DNA-binding response OmpR family regulator
MRLLVIEDDRTIADFIVNGFRQAGFAVDHAADGEAGLEMALAVRYDVAVLDLMLPRRDGTSVLCELRQRDVTTPVVILSAKQSADDRIAALQRGADDYLVKPFVFAELLARVQALLRRSPGMTPASRLACGDLAMELAQREVSRAGRRVDLQPREYALLEYMLRHAGQILSKTMILERIWDYRFDPQTNVVDVLVCRLRNKVDRGFPVKLIHTIRGVGYVLKARSGEDP